MNKNIMKNVALAAIIAACGYGGYRLYRADAPAKVVLCDLPINGVVDANCRAWDVDLYHDDHSITTRMIISGDSASAAPWGILGTSFDGGRTFPTGIVRDTEDGTTGCLWGNETVNQRYATAGRVHYTVCAAEYEDAYKSLLERATAEYLKKK